MGILRSTLLAASQSVWLRERVTRYRSVKRAVARFMPGETVDDAIPVAATLAQHNIGAVLTQLGENVTSAEEARQVSDHYVGVLERISEAKLRAEVSVKPTQLGLDLSPDLCFENLCRVIQRAEPPSVVWIDMEASNYVDGTLDLYRKAKDRFPNVGVCLQAYLYRTPEDLAALMPLGPSIRLVKGAYKEPASVAYPQKKDVDENYFKLATELLGEKARAVGLRAAFGTHDTDLITRIARHGEQNGLAKSVLEFQMLYGIKREEQLRLAGEGFRFAVLISYGSFWFPWYMRRLAERPANLWFVVQNLFAS